MKPLQQTTHPDVAYWTCPRGDVQILAAGHQLRVLTTLGFVAETTDLASILPAAVLDELEDAVEAHEAQHLDGAS